MSITLEHLFFIVSAYTACAELHDCRPGILSKASDQPQALCMPGQHPLSELHPQPLHPTLFSSCLYCFSPVCVMSPSPLPQSRSKSFEGNHDPLGKQESAGPCMWRGPASDIPGEQETSLCCPPAINPSLQHSDFSSLTAGGCRQETSSGEWR